MTSRDADTLRQRIAELEHEMMEFRSAMAKVLSALYDTVHDLERWQRWNQQQEPEAIENLKAVRNFIVSHFNLSEFRNMCFEMGVLYDDLEGETIGDKSREFVLLLNRTGRLSELIQYCKTTRPNATM